MYYILNKEKKTNTYLKQIKNLFKNISYFLIKFYKNVISFFKTYRI